MSDRVVRKVLKWFRHVKDTGGEPVTKKIASQKRRMKEVGSGLCSVGWMETLELQDAKVRLLNSLLS